MDVNNLMPGNGLRPCTTADRTQPYAVQRSLFMHLSSTGVHAGHRAAKEGGAEQVSGDSSGQRAEDLLQQQG